MGDCFSFAFRKITIYATHPICLGGNSCTRIFCRKVSVSFLWDIPFCGAFQSFMPPKGWGDEFLITFHLCNPLWVRDFFLPPLMWPMTNVTRDPTFSYSRLFWVTILTHAFQSHFSVTSLGHILRVTFLRRLQIFSEVKFPSAKRGLLTYWNTTTWRASKSWHTQPFTSKLWPNECTSKVYTRT